MSKKELKELRRNRKTKAMKKWGCECLACNSKLECDGKAQFHHIESKNKYKSLCDLWLRKDTSVIDKELKKCVLLCYDCHMELHKQYGKNVTRKDTTSFLLDKWQCALIG